MDNQKASRPRITLLELRTVAVPKLDTALDPADINQVSTEVVDLIFEFIYVPSSSVFTFLTRYPVWRETFVAIEEQKLARQREAPDLPRMDAFIEPILGPLPTAPGDRKPWVYLCTALQGHYAMSDDELVGVLRRVTFRRAGWYDDGEDYWVN